VFSKYRISEGNHSQKDEVNPATCSKRLRGIVPKEDCDRGNRSRYIRSVSRHAKGELSQKCPEGTLGQGEAFAICAFHRGNCSRFRGEAFAICERSRGKLSQNCFERIDDRGIIPKMGVFSEGIIRKTHAVFQHKAQSVRRFDFHVSTLFLFLTLQP
jgi:hypothetical protein